MRLRFLALALFLLLATLVRAEPPSLELDLGQTATGEIAFPGEEDHIRFPCVEGTSLVAAAKIAKGSTLAPGMRLLDPDGTEVSIGAFLKVSTKAASLKKFVTNRTGVWTLVVRGDADSTGGYGLKTKGKFPKKLAPVEGRIASEGEVHEVKFSAMPGTLLTAKLVGDKKAGFEARFLRLLDPDGGEVEFPAGTRISKGTKDTLKKLPLAAFGEYTLEIGAEDTSTGAYKLVVKLKAPKATKVAHDFVGGSGGADEEIESLRVWAADPAPEAGDTVRLAAAGRTASGREIDLTLDSVFTSSRASVATVSNAAGSEGTLTAHAAGGTVLRAVSHGLEARGTLMLAGGETVAGVTVLPDGATVAKGETTGFTARVDLAGGGVLDGTGLADWGSGEESTATVDDAGTATGVAAGTANLTATVDGTASTPVTLTVTAPRLVEIRISPGASELTIGGTRQLGATGDYSDGSTGNVTAACDWESDYETAATVSATGLVTGAGNGAAGIRARLDGVVSGAALVLVGDVEAESLAVSPAAAEVAEGASIAFTAEVTLNDGSTRDATAAATWSTPNPLTVTEDTTVAAGLLGATDRASVTAGDPAVAALRILPTDPGLAAGATLPFTALATLTDGTEEDRTADAIFASVNGGAFAGATLTAPGSGATAVRATLDGVESPVSVVRVGDAVLTGVAVGSPTEGPLGEGADLSCEATFSTGPVVVVTTRSRWSSADPAALPVTDGVGGGRVVPRATGAVEVVAAFGGFLTPAHTFTGQPAEGVSLGIYPQSPGAPLGLGLGLAAQETLTDGRVRDASSGAAWSSSLPARATVSATGFVTALATGTTSIGATLDGLTATDETFTVGPAIPASIAVAPDSPILADDSTQQMTATRTWSDGSTDDVTGTATWRSSSTGVAVIDASGLLSAVAKGTTNVTAAASGDDRLGSSKVLTSPPVTAEVENRPVITGFTGTTIVSPGDGVDGLGIDGTGFLAGSTVDFGAGVSVSVVSITPTRITVDVDVDGGAEPGARDVTVTLPAPKDHISGTRAGGFVVKGTAPILSSASPGTLDRGGSADLTVTGDNFDVAAPGNMSATLTRDGAAVADISVDGITVNTATELVLHLTLDGDAAFGDVDLRIGHTVNGDSNLLSDAFAVVHPAPTVSTLDPTQGGQGETVSLTLDGTNFLDGDEVAFSGSGVTAGTVTVVSPTRITTDVTVTAGATKSARTVTVTHPVAAGGGSGSKASAFTVTDPVPVIDSISPENVDLGASKTVTLTGANLTSGSVTISPATGLTIGSVTANGSTATFTLTVSAGATVGRRDLTLTRSDGRSATVTEGIKIGPPDPGITSVDPSAVLPGMTRVLFTVTGSRFEVGSTTVSFPGTTDVTVHASSVSVSSSTSLTFEADVKPNAAIGGVDLKVALTGKGDRTKSDAVTIVPADPTITSFSAETLAQGASSFPVTVRGTNFRDDDTLSASGSGVTFSSVSVESTTEITASVSVSSGATTGMRDLTVTHDSDEGGRSATLEDAFEVIGKTPTVTSAVPAKLGRTGSGGATRVFTVKVVGTNFMSGATLSLSKTSGSGVSVVADSVEVLGKTELTARVSVTGTASTGKWTVKVTNPSSLGDGSAAVLEIVSESTLNVNEVVPATGGPTGGERVTVYGSGFETNLSKGATVDFGTVAGSAVQVIDRNTLVVTVPLPASHSTTETTEVDVKVTNDPAGSASSSTLADAYAYGKDETLFEVEKTFPAQDATGVAKNIATCVFVVSEAADATTIVKSIFQWFEISDTSVSPPKYGQNVTVSSVGLGPSKQAVVMKRTSGSNLTPGNQGVYVMEIGTGAKDLSGSNLVPARLAATGSRDQYTWTVGSTADSTAPTVTITPTGTSEDTMTEVSCVFSEEIDPTTLTTTTVILETGKSSGSGTAVPTTLALDDDLKTLTVTPQVELQHAHDYIVTVKSSVKDLSGNAITQKTQTFKTGSSTDGTAPVIDAIRIEDLPSDLDGSDTYETGSGSAAFDVYLPRYGFSLEIEYSDLGGSGIDETSLTVTSSVKVGSKSAGSDLSGNFTVTPTGAYWRIPSTMSVTAGSNVEFKVKIKDQAGNAATEKKVVVDVVDIDSTSSNGGDLDPIDSRETWVLRFDRDVYTVSVSYDSTNGWVETTTSGTPDGKVDFLQALEIIGFQSNMSATGAKTVTNGIDVGTNAIVARMLREAVRERVRERYFVSADGTHGDDAVDIEFLLPGEQGSLSSLPALSSSASANTGNGYSEMDIGGDTAPNSDKTATYSTIGRAFYDARNRRDEADLNAGSSTSSNEGIFVINILKSSVNWYSTSLFRVLYDPFIAGRGGTPIGKDANDATVLAGTFDRTSGSNTSAQNDRYDAIMDGIDALALSLSATTAHEMGHSMGLVEDGAPPTGLFGNADESNSFTEATSGSPNTTHHLDYLGNDIMSPACSFDDRVETGTDFQSFSPYDRNYLRNRQVYDEAK